MVTAVLWTVLSCESSMNKARKLELCRSHAVTPEKYRGMDGPLL